jgi:hypothetical protein
MDARIVLKKTAHIESFGPKHSMADVGIDPHHKSALLQASEAKLMDAEALLLRAETQKVLIPLPCIYSDTDSKSGDVDKH